MMMILLTYLQKKREEENNRIRGLLNSFTTQLKFGNSNLKRSEGRLIYSSIISTKEIKDCVDKLYTYGSRIIQSFENHVKKNQLSAFQQSINFSDSVKNLSDIFHKVNKLDSRCCKKIYFAAGFIRKFRNLIDSYPEDSNTKNMKSNKDKMYECLLELYCFQEKYDKLVKYVPRLVSQFLVFSVVMKRKHSVKTYITDCQHEVKEKLVNFYFIENKKDTTRAKTALISEIAEHMVPINSIFTTIMESEKGQLNDILHEAIVQPLGDLRESNIEEILESNLEKSVDLVLGKIVNKDYRFKKETVGKDIKFVRNYNATAVKSGKYRLILPRTLDIKEFMRVYVSKYYYNSLAKFVIDFVKKKADKLTRFQAFLDESYSRQSLEKNTDNKFECDDDSISCREILESKDFELITKGRNIRELYRLSSNKVYMEDLESKIDSYLKIIEDLASLEKLTLDELEFTEEEKLEEILTLRKRLVKSEGSIEEFMSYDQGKLVFDFFEVTDIRSFLEVVCGSSQRLSVLNNLLKIISSYCTFAEFTEFLSKDKLNALLDCEKTFSEKEGITNCLNFLNKFLPKNKYLAIASVLCFFDKDVVSKNDALREKFVTLYYTRMKMIQH